VAQVYFTDMRTKVGTPLTGKLERLIDKAGLGSLDFEKKFVAIKIHFGELGNLAYLRPQYARVVADYVKARGGLPFLTDCNTLYVGSRKHALEHIDTAYLNGFTPYATGCQVIIADGLKGTDEAYLPIDGEEVKEAKVGRALADADIIISLNHFKGHEEAGFGGALKNVGMGGGSRAGKMEMHSDGKPRVKEHKCRGCGMCRGICAHDAITIENKKASIDTDKCVGCGRCIGICGFDAIAPTYGQAEEKLNRKIAEYAAAILRGKPHFHINIAVDISPNCDCHCENDAPITPDVGMFASFDPVAIDVASADAVNAMPANPLSLLGQQKWCCEDHFTNTHSNTDWRSQTAHAEKLGLGSQEYELIVL